MSKKSKLPVSLFLGLWLVVAFSGPASAETLGLQECVEIALANSLSVRQAQADVEAAGLAIKEAEAAFYPQLSTSYGYVRLDSSPTSTINGMQTRVGTANNFEWQLSVTQPLFTGYALVTGKKLAELGLQNSELTVELARLDLAVEVKAAYFDVLLAIKNLEVADQAVKLLEAQVETARNFFEVGMIPKNDLLQVEVELANTKQTAITAANGVELAKAALNTSLRRDLSAPLELRDILDLGTERFNFRASLEKALAERPEIKQASLGVGSAREKVTLAKSGLYPQVSLTGSYTRTGDTPIVNGSDFDDDPDQASVTIGLSWTIWDWRLREHQVGQAKAGVTKAHHVLNQLKDLIGLEIKQAILNLDQTRAKILVSEKAIEQAEESLRMSQERYKEQVTTSTEVLDAQTRLSQSRANYYAALYGFHLAKAQLIRAMGRM